MDSNSLSSASKAASSAMTSGTSQAASAASEASASLASGSAKASASLASGSAKASSYASNLAKDVPTKSTSFFAISPLTFTLFALAVGYAYYSGYLDSTIAYVQQMLNQAQDRTDQVVKENTSASSLKAAAKGMSHFLQEDRQA